MGIERLAVPENAPGNSRQLVGQRRCHFIRVQTLCSFCQPGAETEFLPILRTYQDDTRRLNKQRPEIFTPAFRYAS